MGTDLTPAQERRLAELVAVYPVADALGRRFDEAGHELYLVGGTVRDTLLHGRTGTDLDFATSAGPEESRRILLGWADDVWMTGAKFGTVSANAQGWKLEITTFRADTYAPDSRHPEVTFSRDIEADLARRDLTVNAMAVRVPHYRFVDPFGGLADLKHKRLRTPIDPETSFGDDPLRMVRLARFAAVLDAEPDEAAFKAASAMAGRLAVISAERIREELNRLITAPGQARGMDLLVDTGLAEQFLPELPALRMERDPIHHHKDVYRHTLAVVDGCPPDDYILRLAALLHDIGKPATREFHSDGKVTFHHHEVVGARMARKRLKALKYSKDEVEQIADLVFLHLRFHGYSETAWSDAAVRRYVRDTKTHEQLQRLNQLTRADVTTRNKAKERRLARAMDHLEERIERLAEEVELSKLRPAMDGNEIMAHLDLPPGPLVGKAYAMLLEARIEEGPMSTDRARELLDRWAAEQDLR